MFTAKVNEQLNALLNAFETGEVSDAIAQTIIKARPVPMAAWSFQNQILCYINGTTDARGFNQWKDVGRHVKKGTRALYILVPMIRKSKYADAEEESARCYGFKGAPVFRYEDTEGEPIDADPIEPPEPPPLYDVAQAWNIPVEYVPFAGRFLGRYQYGNDTERILLCTHNESTFFHELAHAAHHRISGTLKGGQDWKQEIVAELSAAVLARMFGKNTEGNAYRYIGKYAQDAGKDAHRACLAVLSDVKAVLDLILKTAYQPETEAIAAD